MVVWSDDSPLELQFAIRPVSDQKDACAGRRTARTCRSSRPQHHICGQVHHLGHAQCSATLKSLVAGGMPQLGRGLAAVNVG